MLSTHVEPHFISSHSFFQGKMEKSEAHQRQTTSSLLNWPYSSIWGTKQGKIPPGLKEINTFEEDKAVGDREKPAVTGQVA